MNNIIKLQEYIPNSYFLEKPFSPIITSLCYDSREVEKDSVFFVFKGIHTNGYLFIDEAINKGATTIVCDSIPHSLVEGIGYLIVENTRSSFAIVSSYLWDRADKELKIIGISGTDGKSSTATYLYYFLKQFNYKVGLISTVYEDDGTGLKASTNRQSTPEANVLHKIFRTCVNNNIEYLILEATSHSLSSEMDRLNTLEFDLGIITTITSEHLELHKTIDSYIDAKCNLIRKLKDRAYFISTLDNPHLKECLQVAKNHPIFVLKRDLNYTIKQENEFSPIKIIMNNKSYISNLLVDVFITDALLAAKAASILTNIPLEIILNNLDKLETIKGRFNIIDNPFNFTAIVDFAHTGDALYHIVKHVKPKRGKLIALFGSGGERDICKRSQMGKIASSFCDIIIITEEDPRGESNEKISSDIKSGISGDCIVYDISNRNEAINKAINIAKVGDVVLFLGKGHESSIQRKNEKIPWNEKEIVQKAIMEKVKNDR
ncbi:MAG: UDP-N-acetylmuramoyl-L-alanyl-D-glutamate--2,6-diaminopimelate ligase [Spirochaetaceae bacterium]|nr:UDP-N-acetylmuramoyl-L-alanyl-D-glutamate--2,6-diaminopimelate ligase [Spirochaetaceae bacterium]